MKILKTIVLLPIKAVVIALEVVLTILRYLITLAGQFLGIATGLVSGIFIICAFACLATGISSGMEALRMFLAGAAIGAFPALLTLLGESGIDAIKGVLWKVCLL